nr:hypothetical protein BdHM001_17410 [Bdellovibrio sp. HM001]
MMILTACTDQFLAWTPKAVDISGKLLVQPAGTLQNKSANSVAESLSCSGATAKIYKLDSNGEVIKPSLGEKTLSAEGTYSFNADEIGVKISQGRPEFPLVVNIEACGDVLSRPVTGIKDQDVSQGSTLLGYILNTGEKKKLVESLLTNKEKIESMISSLQNAGTVEEAYNNLTANSDIRGTFVEILGVEPMILAEASPQILSLEIPTTFRELQAGSMTVSASHWSPSYQTVYLWKIDNTNHSTNASTTYTPGANSQGAHTIRLYIGKDDGLGGLDLTKPYKSISQAIVVENEAPATAPALTLVTASPTSVNNIQVVINTGAGLENCASFSKLALTVDEPTAPLDLSRYNITCSQAGSQTQAVTLPSGDGSKVLRLWALDASNNISGVASSANIILEQNPPVVTLQNLASLIRGGSVQNVAFTAVDLGVGVEQVLLEYAPDGTTFSELTSYTNPSATSWNFSWTVPVQNTTTGALRVRARDRAANWSEIKSAVFEIDSTAPSLSLTSLNSGSYRGGSTQDITWSASDLHLSATPIKIEYSADNGSTWSSIVAATANSGTYSWALPTMNSSVVRIRVTATDAVGNVSQASSASAITIDSIAPALPTVSLLSGVYSNSATVNLSLSSCSDISKILINESLVTPGAGAAGWQACSLTPSYIVSGEGLHTLQVWVQDSVGNVNSSSVTKSMTLDTTAPLVSLTSLNSGSFRGGEVQSLTWTASDINVSATPIKLEYSSDNGGAWTAIQTSISNSGSYAWTLPSINSSLVKVRVTMTDLAGNTNSATSSGSLVIDSTAPSALSLTRTSGSPSNLSNVEISVSGCSGDATHMIFSESASTPALASPNWEACGAGKTFVVSAGDGNKTVYAWAKDLVGNVSAVSSVVMNLDTTVPSLALTTFQAGAFPGGTTRAIAWNASDMNFTATPIQIEYSQDNGTSWQTVTAGVANSGNSCTVPVGSTGCYNWSLPSIDSTQVKVRITARDQLGYESVVTSSVALTIDSTPPLVNSFAVNSGVATTTSSTVPVGLSAQDNISKISHFCLKYTMGVQTPSAPAVDDACWVAVNAPSPGVSPALSINFSGFYYALGLTNGHYRIFSWVKSEAGLISELSAAGNGTLGVDQGEVEYAPGAPATVVNVIGVGADTHATPPTSTETTVAAGQTLIVKWKITDDAALPNNNIKIYYTLDEKNYTLKAENISNQANGGCSVDGVNYTGCYVTTSPSSAYFKLRLSVLDSSQKVSLASALPNNLGAFRVLAGNTETGIGGSANSAVFNVNSSGTTSGLPGTLAITDDGTVFVRDTLNGILRINPATGLVESFIPTTGVINDGPIGTATLRNASARISVDFANNLLIMDYDRIRKVNLTTNTVSTLIGGGSTRASGTAASSFQLTVSSGCNTCTLTALPNGDILFFDGLSTEKVIWRYQASDQKVYGLPISGTGMTGRPVTDDIASADYLFRHFSAAFDVTSSQITTLITQFHPTVCPGCGANGIPAFIDPNTGQTITSPTPPNFQSGNFKPSVTARDGKIYLVSVEGSRRLGRYNADTNTWTPVLGTGAIGFCEDGIDALACNVNIMDAFVTSDSRIFFIDNGLVRTVDSENKVRTLFGQRLTFGDGGLAVSARIQTANFFDFTSSGDVVFIDGIQNVIRRFAPGGNISLVMGNGNAQNATSGSPAVTSPLTGSWWGGRYQVFVDKATDDIYVNQGSWIGRISNADGNIYRVVGLGGTGYFVADGLPGSSINVTGGESAQLMAVTNGKLLVATSSRNASAQNYRCFMKEYDIANSFTQSHVAGNENLCVNSYPADGTTTATADTGNMSSNLHMPAQWSTELMGWISPRTGTTTLKAYVPGGVITTVKSGLPRMYSSMTVVKNASNQNVLYYCGGGRIYKYNVATSTETALPWPSSAYVCNGYSIHYNAARGTVVFPIVQNGLTSLVEIVDTP